MSEERFTLPAFAKVNLSLRVLGRRADGYHEIRTVFQTVTLHDRLTFTGLPGDSFELECSSPDIPADESNLVHRAAVSLRERFGVRLGARVRVEKKIPAGGGLGGGSSDAAAALVGLARLWRIPAGVRELVELGARLGADVPFFLCGGTALGTGTGADVSPLEDVTKKHLVIVTPVVRVSTAEAYKRLSAPALTKALSAANLSVSRTETEISGSLCEVMRNDFEPVVFGLYPETVEARDALVGAGARRALLSGSGSSLFGVFDSEAAAERAREALGGKAGWLVFGCATLARAEYLRAIGQSAATP